jgi:hypothetical protein
MKLTKQISLPVLLAVIAMWLVACVPMDQVSRPTLDQVRLGEARGRVAEDATLRPGELSGEIDRIDRSRREIYVTAADGRKLTVPFDINRTQVIYHGREYAVDNLEAGDRIAYRPLPRDASYIDSIRVLEPVQARSPSPTARPAPSRSRVDVVEGTVERVDHSLGTFEVRPRAGRMVTVSVPYNASPEDVANFRALRRGDQVRLEGEFINPESLQLLSFMSPRNR